jgi:hypothetical protein
MIGIVVLLAAVLPARAEGLPLCEVQAKEDEAFSPEDIQKLHNCRTVRFPITLQNGFTNDLGQYTGSWKNGKRDGQGAMRNWISMSMTSSWKNDRPSNGLAARSSCTRRTHGYVYNGRFFSFTLPIDWLATVSSSWGLSWVAEAFSELGSVTQSLLAVVLDYAIEAKLS